MHSVLLKIGPITIYSYGFMLMVAFVVATALATRAARRDGLNPDTILDMAPWVLVASIVGARLVYVIQNPGYFTAHPGEIFKVWTGGLSYYGGLGGGLLAGSWYAWRRHVPFWRFADVIAPSVAVGYAIGRVGCFLNGCCYGSPTDLPWACRFHDASVPGGITVPSHPVQLYAAAINVGIFLVLRSVARRPHRPGQVLLCYAVLYGFYRFGIEILRRGATATVFVGGLTSGQLVSLALLGFAVVGLVWNRRGRPWDAAPPDKPARRVTKEPVARKSR